MRRSLTRRYHATALLLALALCAHARSAAATPDAMGPLPVMNWDAGMVTLAGASIHVVVYQPVPAAVRPVVGVIHGASRNGTYQRVMAQTLASYGLVAVVPDMPCTVVACDHAANAMQLLALLDWAVARSMDASSPLAGRVDGARRGLVGHSWGALASELAAAGAPALASLVLLDPNDDAGVGASRAAMVRAPTLQLEATVRGVCNNQWNPAVVTPALGGPRLQVTLPRSGHCDPEDPTDALCPILCGMGSRTTTPYFRRYAVAWTVCNLLRDPSMAPWVAGSAFDADVTAGNLASVVRAGLDGLACVAAAGDGGVAIDSGSPGDASAGIDGGGEDGSVDAQPDAGASGEDVASGQDVGVDGMSAADTARGDVGAGDGADAGGTPMRGGCRCATIGTPPTRAPGRAGWLGACVALMALGAVGRRSRRRREIAGESRVRPARSG